MNSIVTSEATVKPTTTGTSIRHTISVKFKKLHPHAVKPTYARVGDAGLDLIATVVIHNSYQQITYGTGLAVEIPEGYMGLIFPRSSIRNYDLSLSNSVGIIDSGYRGEIQVVFNKTDLNVAKTLYSAGDKIAQMVILPYLPITMIETEELSSSERGTGGFGSTGK